MSIVSEETFVDDDEKETDGDEKPYSILVTSCNMESLIFFVLKILFVISIQMSP